MAPAPTRIARTARFDATGAYRYRLGRVWEARQPRIAFVLLNPSSADARRDDPTLRRVLGFARRWGFGSLDVVNLFAWRTADPRELRRVDDPIGPRNDAYLRRAVRRADAVLVGWGNAGRLRGEDATLSALLAGGPVPSCLGLTAAGQPRHPLYVSAAREPVVWVPAG